MSSGNAIPVGPRVSMFYVVERILGIKWPFWKIVSFNWFNLVSKNRD